jgi:hypothetical protein
MLFVVKRFADGSGYTIKSKVALEILGWDDSDDIFSRTNILMDVGNKVRFYLDKELLAISEICYKRTQKNGAIKYYCELPKLEELC